MPPEARVIEAFIPYDSQPGAATGRRDAPAVGGAHDRALAAGTESTHQARGQYDPRGFLVVMAQQLAGPLHVPLQNGI